MGVDAVSMRTVPVNDATWAAILGHATSEYPREACGLVVIEGGREVYLPCKNLSERDDNFILDPLDYAAAEELGDVVRIVHSHCNLPATPSMADRAACEASGLPWLIVSIPTLGWESIEPTGYQAPFIGRQWVHGVHDCFSLVRDWYREELRIEIRDFERPAQEKWWEGGLNLYADNYEAYGFRRVPETPLQRGDVLLMQMRAPVPNHVAIYLGENLMLHHPHNRLSGREVFGGFWQKTTVGVLRHHER